MTVFRMFRHLNIEVLQLSRGTLLWLQYLGGTLGVPRAGYPSGYPGGPGEILYIRVSHSESVLRGGPWNSPGAPQSPQQKQQWNILQHPDETK